MALLSSNIKTNILMKLNDIINIEDQNWSSLSVDLKLKIVHNLCNFLKNSTDTSNNEQNIHNEINIPLKNQRPKKIIELGGINKQTNSESFNEFRKELITINKNFRQTFNYKNKQYCFSNLSNAKYQLILNNYNQNIYKFLNLNIDKIDSYKLYNSLIGGNHHKIINLPNDTNKLKIIKITHINEFLNIEFNNNITIKLELFLTSEKITSNIPAKYKIFLTNIF